MNPAYVEQTRLMLRVLPFVAKEDCFALKGGTAINFFVRDLPRLSVDIDLVYLPINSRQEALSGISAALKRIKADALRGLGQGFTIQEGVAGGMTSKLFVKGPGGTVKVEPNFVLRGTVSAPAKRAASKKVVATFDLSVSIMTAANTDLYGGKICAALDRQHPRDLFDIEPLIWRQVLVPSSITFAKLIREEIGGAEAATGAVDAGVMADLGEPLGAPVTLGAGLQNLGGRLRYQSSSEELPLAWRLGAAWKPFDGAALAADISRFNRDELPAHAGLEYVFGDRHAFSAAWRW